MYFAVILLIWSLWEAGGMRISRQFDIHNVLHLPRDAIRDLSSLFSFTELDFNMVIELFFSFFPVGGIGFTEAFTKAFFHAKEFIRLNSEFSFQWSQKTSNHRYLSYKQQYFIFL